MENKDQPTTKPLPSVEYSQKYMSWHLKDLVVEVKELNNNLRALIDIVRGGINKPKDDELPPF